MSCSRTQHTDAGIRTVILCIQKTTLPMRFINDDSYREGKAKIRLDFEWLEELEVKVGMYQRFVKSSYLFNVVVGVVPELEKGNRKMEYCMLMI